MISVGAAANIPRKPGPYGQYVLITRDANTEIFGGSLRLVPLQLAGDTLKNIYILVSRAGSTLKIFRGGYVLLPRARMPLKIFRGRYVQFLRFFIDFNYYCLECISKYKYANN